MGKISIKPRYVGTGTFKATKRVFDNVHDVLESGRISYGGKSMEYEKRFAELHDCEYAILSNSGTSSLHVALQALKELQGWKDGMQVIVPATTFVATANVVTHCRLVPVFVDVNKHTYNMDMHEVKSKINEDTAAVIPVHLLGQPANMELLYSFVPFRVKVIEDSCESMFATQKGRKVGSMGDIGCFSTYAAHMIVTGVGGIATTNNPDYAAKMRSLVNHGLMIEMLNPDENFAPQPMINRRFKFDDYGHSYRITELEAAIGLAQLEVYEDMLRARRRNIKHLRAGIRLINKHYDHPIANYEMAVGVKSCYMMYPIVLRQDNMGRNVDKEPLMEWLNDKLVETRDLLPMLNQPIYGWLNPKEYPVSKWLVDSGFYVGCHQDLEPDDIQYVVQCLEEYFDNERRS